MGYRIFVVFASMTLASGLLGQPPGKTTSPIPGSKSSRKGTATFLRASISEYERTLFRLMAEDPAQRREGIEWCPALARVARKRAEDMARRRYFAHIDPDGIGPNGHVAQAGIPLPGAFASRPGENFIESIARGRLDAKDMWRYLSNHAGHREHVLGTDPAWAAQPIVGIGVAADRERSDLIVVVLSLPRPEAAVPARSVKGGRDSDDSGRL